VMNKAFCFWMVCLYTLHWHELLQDDYSQSSFLAVSLRTAKCQNNAIN